MRKAIIIASCYIIACIVFCIILCTPVHAAQSFDFWWNWIYKYCNLAKTNVVSPDGFVTITQSQHEVYIRIGTNVAGTNAWNWITTYSNDVQSMFLRTSIWNQAAVDIIDWTNWWAGHSNDYIRRDGTLDWTGNEDGGGQISTNWLRIISGEFRGAYNTFIGNCPGCSAPSGSNNVIGDPFGTMFVHIGGGFNNRAEGPCEYSTIGGGNGNELDTARYSFIGGGFTNWIGGCNYAVIGGGQENNVQGDYAVIPGGLQNYAFGSYSWAMGNNCVASQDYARAWGRQAIATNFGSLVITDEWPTNFTDTARDQLRTRFTGGYEFTGGKVLCALGSGVTAEYPTATDHVVNVQYVLDNAVTNDGDFTQFTGLGGTTGQVWKANGAGGGWWAADSTGSAQPPESYIKGFGVEWATTTSCVIKAGEMWCNGTYYTKSTNDTHVVTSMEGAGHTNIIYIYINESASTSGGGFKFYDTRTATDTNMTYHQTVCSTQTTDRLVGLLYEYNGTLKQTYIADDCETITMLDNSLICMNAGNPDGTLQTPNLYESSTFLPNCATWCKFLVQTADAGGVAQGWATTKEEADAGQLFYQTQLRVRGDGTIVSYEWIRMGPSLNIRMGAEDNDDNGQLYGIVAGVRFRR
jgi:hypothetical protein